MRIAVLSDIHGNLAALDAVLADLARHRPDLVLHGGDLAALGPRPAEVIDRIRELGWAGVAGNWDLALGPTGDSRIGALPESFRSLFAPLASWTREQIGQERIAWLATLPLEYRHPQLLLLHASPTDLWSAPPTDAGDRVLAETYGGLSARQVVYAHIHHPFVRRIGDLTVANTGSVGLPYDADPRASYLLLSDGAPAIQRVEYDVEREVADLQAAGFPAPAWLAQVQRSGTFSLPAAPPRDA